jgi:hypothetical protein
MSAGPCVNLQQAQPYFNTGGDTNTCISLRKHTVSIAINAIHSKAAITDDIASYCSDRNEGHQGVQVAISTWNGRCIIRPWIATVSREP